MSAVLGATGQGLGELRGMGRPRVHCGALRIGWFSFCRRGSCWTNLANVPASGREQSAWSRLPGSHPCGRIDGRTLCCCSQHLLWAGGAGSLRGLSSALGTEVRAAESLVPDAPVDTAPVLSPQMHRQPWCPGCNSHSPAQPSVINAPGRRDNSLQLTFYTQKSRSRSSQG